MKIVLQRFDLCPLPLNSSIPSQAEGWGVVGKRSVKASASLGSLWTPPLRGGISLEASKFSHTLQMASTYGKHNVSLSAALNTAEKVGGARLWDGHVQFNAFNTS